jgi:hypothetical protein
MKYRKKPAVIDAVQLCWKNWNDVCELMGGLVGEGGGGRYASECSDPCGEEAPYMELTIPTLEGDMIAKHGDFIIKGIKGEFYPCKPDIFKESYNAVDKGDDS